MCGVVGEQPSSLVGESSGVPSQRSRVSGTRSPSHIRLVLAKMSSPIRDPKISQGFTKPGSIALLTVLRNSSQVHVIFRSSLLQPGTKIGDFRGGLSSDRGNTFRICSKLCAAK